MQHSILAKVTVKVDKKRPIPAVKLMLTEKMKEVPDDHVITFDSVKKAYPEIADKIKEVFFTKSNRVTVKQLKKMVEELNAEDVRFWMSERPWTMNVQKKLSDPQVAIQLNFTPKMVQQIKTSPATLKYLTSYFADFAGGQHPLNNQTFAWARVYKFPEMWVIEEIQSDYIGWDKDFKFMTEKMEARLNQLSEDERKEVKAFFVKHLKGWEKQFLATITQMARAAKAKKVLMFDSSEKQGQQTSPSKLKWFYETIPRDVGFKKTKQAVQNKQFSVWEKVLAQPSYLPVLAQLVSPR